jgi:hypothetical protein
MDEMSSIVPTLGQAPGVPGCSWHYAGTFDCDAQHLFEISLTPCLDCVPGGTIINDHDSTGDHPMTLMYVPRWQTLCHSQSTLRRLSRCGTYRRNQHSLSCGLVRPSKRYLGVFVR